MFILKAIGFIVLFAFAIKGFDAWLEECNARDNVSRQSSDTVTKPAPLSDKELNKMFAQHEAENPNYFC